ncbi:MAG TPA: 23S rRNA (guanine(1835)-N(2))-methyltransferase, partial [Pantoea sp.]|nr:23S rRNA (guanine(1835)-N(2))-methyltransferase [Pantoea sp.]
MSQLELNDRTLILHRFPQMRDESPLQAWDAADEYLLQQTLPDGPVLVVNDSFGALTCALNPRTVWHISDSWLSQQATRQNLALNALDDGEVHFLDSLAALPAAPAAVLIKVPKTLALLEHQLRAIRQVATPETVILAAARAKEIHNSTLQLFEQIIGETRTSLAWKKARLIYSQFTQPALRDAEPTLVWPLDGTPYQIHNYANVFSRASLDIG